ncbi:M48 family metallopeptidase [Diaphorobacter aerolatus]|uniref:M48 family metallopeptidase n=1 Tax=Diaphorobacter aerolatus TaxID=1288495 RepID=A0A7H0GHE9_9BURK|nr:M48 family metallopeptidase [Diaphorobacter aerolatus]QNP47715.1 M48 family metallopeptidase [Diaphorobacter aerolatus]
MLSTRSSPPPNATTALIRANWFDGQSSQPRKVLVSLSPSLQGGPDLLVHPLQSPGDKPRRYAHRSIEWPEAWSTRRPQETLIIDLKDGGSLEILEAGKWQDALAAADFRPGIAQRMQTRWPMFVGVFVVAAIGMVAFYKYGTPWAAAQLTRWVPLSWESALSSEAMAQMDEGMLKPSKLSKERQQQLRDQFDSLLAKTPASLKRYHGYEPRYTLQFRRGMGANAFALPGGTIVVTDGLVDTARSQQIGDDAIIGVLAHEIGHVAHRHTTRMVVEQGVLQTGLGLALGDVSALISTGSTLLTGLAYQRNHEREADCFAIALLKNAEISTVPMGELLLAMAARRGKDGEEKDKDRKDTTATAPHAPASSASNPDGAANREAQTPEARLTSRRKKPCSPCSARTLKPSRAQEN